MSYRFTVFLHLILFAVLERNHSFAIFFVISGVDLTGLLEVIESFTFRRELTAYGHRAASRCALQCVLFGNCTSFEVCMHQADTTCKLMQSLTTSYPLYYASVDCDLYAQVNTLNVLLILY